MKAEPKISKFWKAPCSFYRKKIPEYEQAIRKKKYNDKLEKKMKETDEKESNFAKFEQAVKLNLEQKQKNIKASFLQKLHN